MPLETNLNVTPYYDDFNENKNFHRVLFQPGVAVQARELTQLQTILQNQIERFGDNIFKIGTIIKGCDLSPDYFYNYIKIKDDQVDGQPVNLNLYANSLIIQESINLHSYVVNSLTGFESSSPNLNTLYIKYINTGTGGQKVYSAEQVIKVFNRNRTIEDFTVVDGGTLYSNSDTVTFSGGGGTGATATLTTDATGKIVDVSIVSKGNGYTTSPNVSITTSTGSGANVSALNYISELTIASAAISGATDPVGIGAAIKCTEGIIYQKGHFIRVDPHEIIVERYSNLPNNVVVGFKTSESIVNSNADSSLLDLATGSPNFAAPGANRLKLTPSLVAITKNAAEANGEFLSLIEFENGLVVRDRLDTQFNSVSNELNKRTFEESGNYVLDTVQLNTEDIAGNTTHFNVVVGAGTIYVNGERIQLVNSVRVPAKKGTDFSNTTNKTINTLFGSYVIVNQLLGDFPIKEGTTVNLRNSAGTDVTDNAGGTPSTPGTIIGTAKIRSLIYDSGTPGTHTAQYKLYLFDVRMSSGYSFKDVRSITDNSNAIADVVLDNSIAVLKDIDNDILVFNTGTQAVREFNNEEFIYRTSNTLTLSSGGSATLTLSGGSTVPYGDGDLTDSQVEEVIIMPVTSFTHSSNNAGTVAANTTSNTITGTSTTFTSTFRIGDYFVAGNSTVRSAPQLITSINSDTSLQLISNFSGLTSGGVANAVANGHFIGYPANVPIDFTRPNKSITVGSSGTTLTIAVGANINATPQVVIYHDVKEIEPTVRVKTLNNPVYVKLSTDSLRTSLTGPWCIGVPDVLSIEAVYVGTSNTYSESTTNYASEFELDNGQRDNYYGLAYIKKTPGSSLTLSQSNCLLVKVKALTHGSGKYLSTESYPIDDTTTTLPSNKIRTESIPVYISSTSGESFSLRDCVDFRPIVANTAVLSSTAASANVDPSSTETLTAGDKYFPSPTKPFECDIQFYLNRIDRISIGKGGRIKLRRGIPSINPSLPAPESGMMDLGILKVAPFPSLSAKNASTAKRQDLKNTISLLQTRRYTMKDINDLETRIQRLEYYTLLSTLESETKNTTIPSDANNEIEVFKNGFFVDSFDSYTTSNINDGEFKAAITNSRLVPITDIKSVDLKYNSTTSSNVQKNGDLVTLSYTENELIKQPVANKLRTLVETYWKYIGKMQVVPRVDNFFDVQTTSTSAIDVNIADPVTSLVAAQNEINRQLITSSIVDRNVGNAILVNEVTENNRLTQSFNQNITTSTTTTVSDISVPPTVTSTVQVGNLLTSTKVNTYVREQRIGLQINGLRPGAQHYVFFDNVDLTSRCKPATVSSYNDLSIESFVPIFNKTASPGLYADDKGELNIILDIPANTFISGEKVILVMDVNILGSETSATSKSIGRFLAFAQTGTATNLSIATKSFDLSLGDFTKRTFTSSTILSESRGWSVARDFTPVVTPPVTAPTTPSGADGTFIVTEGIGGIDDIDIDNGDDGDDGDDDDPLAQSFLAQSKEGGDVIFITSIDVYFRAKDSSKGVTLELREVGDTGFVTKRVLPYSTVYKQSSEINVSADSLEETKFTFTSPVSVKNGNEYAIVLKPDGNSPEYRIWTAIAGEPDVSDETLISNKSWGLGTMFYSTSNRAFSAVQDEDIKFVVNYATFSPTSGVVTLNNGDYEFLTINSVSGGYRGGEVVAQMANSYINANLTTDSTNTTIVTAADLTSSLVANNRVLVIFGTDRVLGTANVKIAGTTVSNYNSTTTTFTTDYDTGDFIALGNEVRQVISVTNSTSLTIDVALNNSNTNSTHYNVTPKFDVLKVVSANSTSITVDRPPSYNVSATVVASMQKVVKGTVEYYNATDGLLYLKDSTSSNSTSKFVTANSTYFGYIVGDTSDALSKIVSIDNISGVAYTPLINYILPASTATSLEVSLTKSGGSVDTRKYPLDGSTRNDINDTFVIKSLSNEIVGSTINKSFQANIAIGTSRNDTSPIIDVSPASIIVSNYKINNDDTDENTRYGNAQAKYISKRLILADGLDAEDIKVYIRAYKPFNTNIDVYAKILNSADNEEFNTKDWSQLKQITDSSLYSSSVDTNDLKEYEFTFKSSPLSNKLNGVITTNGTTTVEGSGTMFTYSFNALSGVANTTDAIAVTNNKFKDGDRVTYTVASGNTALTNLVSNNKYYIVSSNSTHVKLSSSLGGSTIDLTSGTSESGHSISSIVAGDIVKLVNTNNETDYDIIPVASVTDLDTLVLATATSFSSTSATIEQVYRPHEAFKYNKNSNIVRYFDNNNGAHDNYKFLAVKIVLKSSLSYVVPQVHDIRAIAISV